MKNIISTSVIAIILMIGISSCKKHDSNSNSATVLNSTVQQGTWKIKLFNDSGNDETYHFTSYSFQFNNDGTVTASSAATTVTGTWSGGNDDSDVKLVLNFGSTSPFDELNEDWHVLQQSSSTIECEHISGGNGGTDYLTFEKI